MTNRPSSSTANQPPRPEPPWASATPGTAASCSRASPPPSPRRPLSERCDRRPLPRRCRRGGSVGAAQRALARRRGPARRSDRETTGELARGHRGASGSDRRGERQDQRHAGRVRRRGARRGQGRRRRGQERRQAGAASRRAVHHQGQPRPGRQGEHQRDHGEQGAGVEARRAGGRAHESGRRHPAGPHQPARPRAARPQLQRAVGTHAQSVEREAQRRRIERRRSRGARRRHDADRAGQRHRRVAAQPGQLLRHRRAQAVVRAHPERGRVRRRRRGAGRSWRSTVRWRERIADVRLGYQILSGQHVRDPWSMPVPLDLPDPPGRRSRSRWWRSRAGARPTPTSPPACARRARRSPTRVTRSRRSSRPASSQAFDIWMDFLGSELHLSMDYFKQVMSPEAFHFIDLVMSKWTYRDLGGYVGSLSARHDLATEWSEFFTRYPLGGGTGVHAAAVRGGLRRGGRRSGVGRDEPASRGGRGQPVGHPGGGVAGRRREWAADGRPGDRRSVPRGSGARCERRQSSARWA